MHMYSEFEKNALGLFGELLALDKEKSSKLLTRPNHTWKDSTVFGLVNDADLTDFKENACYQTHVDKIWYGELTTPTSTSPTMWKVRLNRSTVQFVTSQLLELL